MMNPIDERLAEEVRKYQILYVASLKSYKNAQVTSNSWSEIAKAVDLSVPECVKRWRALRDKFVRLRKKMASCSGDEGGEKKLPKLYVYLSWLSPHVKHRETSSNCDVKEQDSQGRDHGEWESPVDDYQASPTPSPSTTTVLPVFQPSPTPGSATVSTRSPTVTPVSMSQSPPAVPSAVSHKTSSPLSPTGRKRQRLQQEENFDKELGELKENKNIILRQVEQPEDAITHFTKTIGDMLRKVANEDQDDAMHDIYAMLYGHIKLQVRNLKKPEDAITRFAETIGDMLRKVADEDQDDVMHDIYAMLDGRIKLQIRHLEKPEDTITRFTETISDMLRKVADEHQDDAMHDIYAMLYGCIKLQNANRPTEP